MKVSPQIITFDTDDINKMVDWYMKDTGFEVLAVTTEPDLIKEGIVVEVERKSGWQT